MEQQADTGTRFVVRVTGDLASAVEEAAEQNGLSRSEWMRQVFEAAIMWDWIGRNRTLLVHAPTNVGKGQDRKLGMSVHMPTGVCLHPPMAREALPTAVRCGLCGQQLKQLI